MEYVNKLTRNLKFTWTLVAVLALTCLVLLAVKTVPAKSGYSFLGICQKPSPGYITAYGTFFWCPGSRHPAHPHVYAGVRENSWQPDDGYAFVTNKGFTVQWVPDVVIGAMPNVKTDVEEGNYLVKKNCETCNGAGKLEERCGECESLGVLKVKAPCTSCATGIIECAKCKSTGKLKCHGVPGVGTCANGRCPSSACNGGTIGWGMNCLICFGSGKCKTCNGAGALTCSTCNGKGKYACKSCNGETVIVKDVKCHVCDGAKKLAHACDNCTGLGYVWEKAPQETAQRIETARLAVSAQMRQKTMDNLQLPNQHVDNSAVQEQEQLEAFRQNEMMQRQFEYDMQRAHQMMQMNAAMNAAIMSMGQSMTTPMPAPIIPAPTPSTRSHMAT